MELLADRGIATQYHQPRTLWPMLEETVAFTHSCRKVYVVEYNATGQIAQLIIGQGGDATRIDNIIKYDCTPMRAEEIVDRVVNDMSNQEVEVA